MSLFLITRRTLLTSLSAIALIPTKILSGDAFAIDSNVLFLRVGDTTVQVFVTERLPSGLTLVSVHENEQPAVAAARRFVERHGGRLLELKSQRQRLVTFRLAGTRYTFDPNRIFTSSGIAKSLRLNGPYSRPAHDAVAQFAERLIGYIRKNLSPPLIAVHNNSAGALSVESYRKGANLEREASRVAINPKLDPDDFFLVTDELIFDRLTAAGFNVVLQSDQPSDDGSLSVFCVRNRISYVNVESEFRHSGEQSRMLEAIADVSRNHRSAPNRG